MNKAHEHAYKLAWSDFEWFGLCECGDRLRVEVPTSLLRAETPHICPPCIRPHQGDYWWSNPYTSPNTGTTITYPVLSTNTWGI